MHGEEDLESLTILGPEIEVLLCLARPGRIGLLAAKAPGGEILVEFVFIAFARRPRGFCRDEPARGR
jgi:hypothetical protein